jgi:hypothetical protein
LQTKLSKALVLADQVGGCVREQIEALLKVGTAWRVLEVFDNVELDVALAYNIQRAPALPSARIVVHTKLFHAWVSFRKRVVSLADQA